MCIFAAEMNSGIRLLVLLSVFGLLAISCLEEPECRENDDTMTLAFFSATDGSKLAVALDSIWIKEQNNAFFTGKTLSEVTLPLALDGKTMYFEIHKDSTSYSVDMTYDITPVLYSLDCNVQLLIVRPKIVDTTLDSIATHFDESPIRLNIYF